MSRPFYKRIVIKNKCKICGKEFEQEIIDSKWGRSLLRKCCSLSCSGKCSDKGKLKRIIVEKQCEKCGTKFSKEIPDCDWGYTLLKRFCSRSCASSRPKSEKSKEKVSLSLLKHSHTDKSKQKMRLSAIERINKTYGQISPNYNKKSIPILEQKAKELEITDLQHAENGGEFYIPELGYWADGYSKEKNIWIEVDEKYHRSKRQQNKDKTRQKEIKEFLGCKFIRLKI